MDQQIKEKWLKALRSGEYEQTTGNLHTVEGFCCLGVLCDINKKELGWDWNPSSDGVFFIPVIEEDAELPQSLAIRFGLHGVCVRDPNLSCKHPDGRTVLNPALSVLMEMNDEGYSFNQIADFIEENL